MTLPAWNKTLLSSVSYGKVSICQAEFSFAPSKLFVQTLIIDKYNKNVSIMFALL